MIDCHIHTKRSHHGQGDLEDFVIEAIDKNLKIVGFLEHGPFLFDEEHRMTEEETLQYLQDANLLKEKYAESITILAGLEIDYTPSAESYLRELLPSLKCDSIFGGIHFIESPKGIVRIWDFEELQEKTVIEQYFDSLKKAVSSCLFDGIVHPDTILRTGISAETLIPSLIDMLGLFREFNIAYEINSSGLTKPSYNPLNKTMRNDAPSYPNLDLVYMAYFQGIPVTIGSDAHSPDKLGENISSILTELKKNDMPEVHYFQARGLKRLVI